MLIVGVAFAVFLLVAVAVSSRWPQLIIAVWLSLIPFQAMSVVALSLTDRSAGARPALAVLPGVIFVLLQFRFARSAPAPLTGAFRHFWFLAVWMCIQGIVVHQLFDGKVTILSNVILQKAILETTFSNYLHTIYYVMLLSAAVLTAWTVAWLPARAVSFLMRVYVAAGMLAGVLVVWHGVSVYIGGPFPSGLLYSNASYQQNQLLGLRPDLGLNLAIKRISGSFTEPSHAATYMAAVFCGGIPLLFEKGQRLRRLAISIFNAVTLLLTVSTTAVAGAVVGVVIGVKTWLNQRGVRKRTIGGVQLAIAVMLSVAVLVGLLQFLPGFGTEIEIASRYLLIEKLTAQHNQRLDTELFTVDILRETSGLGAGIGSTLAFTLQSYTLSTMGIPGAVLVVSGIVAVARRVRQELRESWLNTSERRYLLCLSAAATSLLISGIVAAPSLLDPNVYAHLGLLVGIAGRGVVRRERARRESAAVVVSSVYAGRSLAMAERR